MEVSKYVNLHNVSEFLTGEIKEVSERWGQFMITKIAVERVLKNQPPTKEEMADYEEVKSSLDGKKPTDVPRFLAKVENDKKTNYEKVNEYKSKETALENANKGLIEFEEFLEVATELKKEIDTLMK